MRERCRGSMFALLAFAAACGSHEETLPPDDGGLDVPPDEASPDDALPDDGSPDEALPDDGSADEASPDDASVPSPTNALYVWWHGFEILEHQAERDNLFRIAEAENVNLLYVAVTSDSINWFQPGWRGVPNAWATLVSQARTNGIEVHALLGGTTSVFADTVHDQYVRSILSYNVDNPENRLSGITFDIEPYATGIVENLTSYIRRLKSVAHAGETITSQGLTLSIYIDPPQWLTRNWGTDHSSIVGLYREFDVININSYQGTLDDVIMQAADGPSTCQEAGIPFLIGLETDDAWSYGPGTLFEEGKDAYHALQASIDAFMRATYSEFVGQYTDHYQKSVSWWHMIRELTWPEGAFRAGETVGATVELVRSDSYPPGPVGLQLEVRNGAYSARTSRIVVLPGVGSRSVVVEWPIPDTAPSGAYDVEVSTWEIDLEDDGRRSILYYTDFAGDDASLEAVDLEQLESRSDLSGKRTPFVLLDRASQAAAFTIVDS